MNDARRHQPERIVLGKDSTVPPIPKRQFIRIIGSDGKPLPMHPVVRHLEFQPSSYVWSLDSFSISNTRSLHDDTDYVSCSIWVDGQEIDKKDLFLGDRNNGSAQLGIVVGPVHVTKPEQEVTFVFAMINQGHEANSDKTKQELDSALKALATATGVIGSWWAAGATAVIDYVVSLIFANCDGPVASDRFTYTANELWSQTNLATSSFPAPRSYYPGTESSDGCGSNSEYHVYATAHGVGRTAPSRQGIHAVSTASA
jgi:hypothetical protein